MAAMAGRAIRISFNPGSGMITVVGSTSDGFEITKEGINITDKDDAGVQRFLDDAVGTWAMSGSIEGILKDDALLLVANDTTSFTLPMSVAVGGLGTYTGNFALTNFSVTGEDGAEAATFSAQLASSGTIAYT